MDEMVLGFLFDVDFNSVMLIRKNRPAWQAGKLNGIGGHVEEGDVYPKAAMIRECKEETDVWMMNWKCFATLTGVAATWKVHCFYCTAAQEQLRTVKGGEEGPLTFHDVKNLPDDVLPNLHWLIPMAIASTKADHAKEVSIREVA